MDCYCYKLSSGYICDFHREERAAHKDYRNMIAKSFYEEYYGHPDAITARMIANGASPHSLIKYRQIKNASIIYKRYKYFSRKNPTPQRFTR